jgi:hypothetical protein
MSRSSSFIHELKKRFKAGTVMPLNGLIIGECKAHNVNNCGACVNTAHDAAEDEKFYFATVGAFDFYASHAEAFENFQNSDQKIKGVFGFKDNHFWDINVQAEGFNGDYEKLTQAFRFNGFERIVK